MAGFLELVIVGVKGVCSIKWELIGRFRSIRVLVRVIDSLV